MKNRITMLVLGVAVLFASAVYAENVISFGIEDGAVVFESGHTAVISCYDENGVLVYSDMYEPEDGKITADIPEEFSETEKRVYIVNENEISRLEKAEEAEMSPSPEPTAEVSPSPTPETPSVYPSQSDAKNAFMVCEKVSLTQNSDGDDAYLIDVFYQGRQEQVTVNSDALIMSAPERNIALSGLDASALCKGDVFRITYNLSKTRVTRIDLILRPDVASAAYDSEDYGDNFETLFSYNNGVGGMKNWTVAKYGQKNSEKYLYAFGIVADKTQNTISLMNKGGKTEDILEIETEKDTVVYECSISDKYEISSVGRAGITKTSIPRSLLNEEKIVWTSDEDYSYALVRIIDDTATDIIIFNNF